MFSQTYWAEQVFFEIEDPVFLGARSCNRNSTPLLIPRLCSVWITFIFHLSQMFQLPVHLHQAQHSNDTKYFFNVIIIWTSSTLETISLFLIIDVIQQLLISFQWNKVKCPMSIRITMLLSNYFQGWLVTYSS